MDRTGKFSSIISFDLDMTLLDHKTYRISDSAMESVERLRERHRIVLATGRDMDNHYSRPFKEQLKPDGIIHMNGTKVTVGSQLIYDHLMDKKLLRSLLTFAQDHGLSLGATIDDQDYYTSPEAVMAHDQKKWGDINRQFTDPFQLLSRDVRSLAYIGGEDGVRLLEEHFPQMRFPLFGGKVGADVVEKEVSKAEGLKHLCEYWGISPQATAAFGDSMNDMEILKASGIGIAMGNGIEELRREADYVTARIEQDGVKKACEHFNWFYQLTDRTVS